MLNQPKVLGVIPARYASTRFPGKPLIDIRGKSMIRRVYEQVGAARWIDEVIVATDDERILEHVQEFGGQVEMTASTHRSGTDRCAEVAARKPSFTFVINIQGDEPFINPSQIDQVIEPLLQTETVAISTLAKRISAQVTLFDPNVVKAVFAETGRALYFSRSPIPFLRGVEQHQWVDQADYYKHIGIYGFRRQALLEVAKLPPSALEQQESLEQLRWLAAAYPIHVGVTEIESIGIDHPEDLDKI